MIRPCMRSQCQGTATRGELCTLHAAIARAAARCMRRECRPSCTRGGCWRKTEPTQATQ